MTEPNELNPTIVAEHHVHFKAPGDLWARFKRFFPAKGDVSMMLVLMIRDTVERLEAKAKTEDKP